MGAESFSGGGQECPADGTLFFMGGQEYTPPPHSLPQVSSWVTFPVEIPGVRASDECVGWDSLLFLCKGPGHPVLPSRVLSLGSGGSSPSSQSTEGGRGWGRLFTEFPQEELRLSPFLSVCFLCAGGRPGGDRQGEGLRRTMSRNTAALCHLAVGKLIQMGTCVSSSSHHTVSGSGRPMTFCKDVPPPFHLFHGLPGNPRGTSQQTHGHGQLRETRKTFLARFGVFTTRLVVSDISSPRLRW